MTRRTMTRRAMTRVLRGRVVTPDGVIEDGLIRISDGRIAEVRPAQRQRRAKADPVWILPGFVDIHAHGGGGHTFTTGDPDQARAVAAFHGRHGTTTLLASLVTGPPDATRAAVAALAPLVSGGVLAGLHLEGPYLAAARRGAQNAAHLRDPDLAELDRLLQSGVVRMVTVAPERPGALAAIGLLARRGVVAAIGHTDATYEQTRAAIDAGATVATHLCNAMRPVHHREPGPIVALLDAPQVICELIADGVHLHDGMLRHIVTVAGPNRVALVTDAMAAAGMPDGEYELGGQAVSVRQRVARLAAGDAIAGSTLTMDAALRRAIHNGADLVAAATMAATTPARAIGLAGEVGAIAVGLRADLVLLDDDFRVTAVLRRGRDHTG